MSEPILSRNFLNESVKPGDDFYEYAVGGWLKNNPIPPAYSRWGDFEMLVERNYALIQGFLEKPERFAGSPEEILAKKAAQFFASGLDEKRIEESGVAVLQPIFDDVAAIKSAKDLAMCVGRLHRTMIFPLFYFGSTPDSKQSNQVIAGLGQGGLGLPDRDYYFDDKYQETRVKYWEHIDRMFTLAQLPLTGAGQRILKLETELASHSKTKVELRDPVANYNKLSMAQVKELCPYFDWQTYFEIIGLGSNQAVDVGQLQFFAGLNTLFAQPNWLDWQIYLQWHVLLNSAPFLSSAFGEENFAFYKKYLIGQKEQKPRFKRVIGAMHLGMGQAIGRLYVREYFPPVAKERAKILVGNITAVMRERIQGLTWMEASTKKSAEKKLDSLLVKIGYPDKWINFGPLTVDSSDYLMNVIRAREFEFNRDLEKIGKPVDRTDWMMDPHEINAYYSPLHNEIVFPAGILQEPFFSAEADDAINYGGIGAVIGHEITHGFDDQGRQYDAQGNLHDWWTQNDEKKFKETAAQLVEQFNAYEPLPGQHVNGELTLGENIADLAGLTIAYLAFEKTLLTGENKNIDGFTPQQRFFWSWANTWKENKTDERVKLHLVIDPHSPSKYRTNGPVSNLEWFFQAFGIKSGQTLYRSPGDRVIIW